MTTHIEALPCPTWCASHTRGGDHSTFHASAVHTIDQFADGELTLGATSTVTVGLEQYEAFDPDTRQVSREDVEVVIRDDRGPAGFTLMIQSAESVRRLGEALIDAARRMETSA